MANLKSATTPKSADQPIMNTNNSCIVSKRSVEKLYHNQDNGLRYFVNKFVRRAPLINRGYWLRMRAIEQTLRDFLSRDGEKLVVNLGCGYDVLPFKFLSRERDLCRHARFVDVDYPALVRKKCDVIKATKQLSDTIGYDDASAKVAETASAVEEIDFKKKSKKSSTDLTGVMIDTKRYIAIGCNLTDVPRLDKLLKSIIKDGQPQILFIAEVSITYLTPTAADAIIQWASSYASSSFCILEQCLPAGHADTAFATTMLKHFSKLQSLIQPVLQYPMLSDQRKRFEKLGWTSSQARTLWELWLDKDFIAGDERRRLDAVEPFDEWEEFALFAQHYFILIAGAEALQRVPRPAQMTQIQQEPASTFYAVSSPLLKSYAARHHAAGVLLDSRIVIQGGQTTNGRVSELEQYSISAKLEAVAQPSCDARCCHTLTSFRKGLLVVGGRASPDKALSTCCLYSDGAWKPAQRLPHGRYRHCAVTVHGLDEEDADGVLVFGGKSSATVLNGDFLLFHKEKWQTLLIKSSDDSQRIPARFGASMIAPDGMQGYIVGGLDENGLFLHDVWHWTLRSSDDNKGGFHVESKLLNAYRGINTTGHLSRFGACILPCNKTADDSRDTFLLVGGIGEDYLGTSNDITQIKISKQDEVTFSLLSIKYNDVPTPMLVGHCAHITKTSDASTEIVITGGGATCFSFGTWWNAACWTLRLSNLSDGPLWQLASTDTVAEKEERLFEAVPPTRSTKRGSHAELRQVNCRADFEQIVRESKPVTIRGLDVGECTTLWSVPYLSTKLESRIVTVHVSTKANMDFVAKNFTYQKMSFAELVERAAKAEPLYLRALSSEKPADQPTFFEQDFPEIAEDFVLPQELSLAKDNIHSSPFRVSGPVNMWLHYDCMANVLCQIKSPKRLVLFAPKYAVDLGFAAGASSSQLSVFDEQGNVKREVSRYRPVICDLQEGDVLFIPPLWAHTARPTDGVSFAVNVFFKSLDERAYDAGRDVYGNRDMQAYRNSRRDVQRIASAFKDLPGDVAGFYLRRLAAELVAAAEQNEALV